MMRAIKGAGGPDGFVQVRLNAERRGQRQRCASSPPTSCSSPASPGGAP